MKNSEIYGIAFGCPKLVREKNCPLLEIDSLSLTKKIDWIEDFDNEKIAEILNHHSHCTKKIINHHGVFETTWYNKLSKKIFK